MMMYMSAHSVCLLWSALPQKLKASKAWKGTTSALHVGHNSIAQGKIDLHGII